MVNTARLLRVGFSGFVSSSVFWSAAAENSRAFNSHRRRLVHDKTVKRGHLSTVEGKKGDARFAPRGFQWLGPAHPLLGMNFVKSNMSSLPSAA